MGVAFQAGDDLADPSRFSRERSTKAVERFLDSDGRIERFIDLRDVARWIPLHDFVPGHDYVIGVFLVGAYQEILGDLHNFFGDANVVSVVLDKEGEMSTPSKARSPSGKAHHGFA